MFRLVSSAAKVYKDKHINLTCLLEDKGKIYLDTATARKTDRLTLKERDRESEKEKRERERVRMSE